MKAKLEVITWITDGGNNMDNRYNRHNRRKYSLKAYIVLVTKYRKQLLKDNIAEDIKQKI